MTRDREVERDAPASDEERDLGASVHRTAPTSSRRAHWVGIAALLALIAFGALVRIHTAFADPNFDRVHAEGMLKSDPGLLYYFTERILESGGGVPSDFRADPRVEYPLITDIPAMFPVGQEFVVAWCYRWFGGAMPLHAFCVWAMGFFAALCACGVYGLAFELSGRVRWALFAAALYTLLPANYRTIGFILVGEDFSVPWFVLHLWLLARASRLRTATSAVLAAIPLGIALSTWHATSFFFTIEAVCVLAWFLRTRENPFTAPGAGLFVAVLAAFGALVPVLRSTLFVLSLPMQWMAGMLVAARWARTRGTRRVAIACAASLFVAALVVSSLIQGGLAQYSHVFGLVWQKLLHFGRLPEDPRELPFEVRLMWQGPFDTLDPAWGLQLLGVSAVFIAPAAAWAWSAWRNPTSATHGRRVEIALVASFLVISLPIAWLIERTILLPGILLPVVAACAISRVRQPVRASALAIAALLIQALLFATFVREHRISWYRPPQRQREIAALVAHIPELVPEGAAIASDFMNSTAILAHTGHPIVLQPKYEFRRSRERAERFFHAFFEGPPDDLRELVIGEFRARYLLIDRYTLGFLSRYAAGIPRGRSELVPGTAAAVFLSQNADRLEHVPGYRLLYRSPPDIVQSDGSPTDFFRLYELDP